MCQSLTPQYEFKILKHLNDELHLDCGRKGRISMKDTFTMVGGGTTLFYNSPKVASHEGRL